MTSEEVVSIFEEYDLRRKKIFLFTGEDGRKFRRILLEKENITDDDIVYLRELIKKLKKHGFYTPAKALENWLEERI